MAIQQGWGSMTPAVQNTLRRALGTTVRRAKRVAGRAVSRAMSKRGKKKRAARPARKARLVKGSAAAKRYMAKLRRMRKK